MTITEFINHLNEFPDRLRDKDDRNLSRAGALVEAKARIRIPYRTGRMASTIHNRRSGASTQQIYSNHPGAKVNEQDPRWRNPPRHWLTTSLIDSHTEIQELFRDGIQELFYSLSE